MNITSRKDAINAGKNTYFTGVPCINGHTAYRYTKSATCSACVMANRPVSASNEPAEVDPAAVAAREQTIQARSEMGMMKYRADFSDVASLVGFAHSLSMARYPLVKPTQLRKNPSLSMQQGSSAMVSVYLHTDDHPLVDQMRAALWSKHTMGHEGVMRLREQIFGEAAKLAEKMNKNSGPAGGYGSIPR